MKIVTLTDFNNVNASKLAQLCNNKKIWINVKDAFPHPYSEENAVTFIKICQQEDPQCTFAILYGGELAGAIGLELQTDVYRKSAELGYWIGEPMWGLGIATNAVKQIVEYGFKSMGLIRIYSGVFEYNYSSMRVLEKNGFYKECIAKKAIIKNGSYYDAHRYAILREDI